MKTMNNNNIENEKNVVVANNAAVEVTEESRKAWSDAYGNPSGNEDRGWKLDHVIAFDYYHNAYIMSHKGIGELVQMVCQECGIKPEETDNWAKDLRTIIKYYIETFDMFLETSEETPDECNRIISGQFVGDGIEFRCEAYEAAGNIMPHTFGEEKEYFSDNNMWEAHLNFLGVTEEERKAYLDSLPRTDI